jgi:hypothetical protein
VVPMAWLERRVPPSPPLRNGVCQAPELTRRRVYVPCLFATEVWPPAFVLARYLESTLVNELADCHVLEVSVGTCASVCPPVCVCFPFLPRNVLLCAQLGSGCGLVGLVAAHLGAASVTLTDLPCALPTLRRNVEVNVESNVQLLGCVRVRALDWNGQGDEEEREGSVARYSLIIASECLYDEESVLPLLHTAHAKSADDTTFLLSGIIGSQSVRLFQRHAADFFASCAIAPNHLDGSGDLPVSRAIHILREPLRRVAPVPPDILAT